MSVIRSLLLALSTFTRLPVPRPAWDPRNMRLLLALFPVAGAAVGALLWGWFWLSGALGFGDLLFAAGVALIPVAVTGGIHLDGFCDTCDALASHASAERRREILKDPHLGAFGAIALGCYLLLACGIAAELPRTGQTAWALGGFFIASRAISGVCSLKWPLAAPGSLSTMRAGSAVPASLWILAAILAAVAVAETLLFPIGAAVAAVAAALTALLVRRMALRQFGGVSGDLSGYLLSVCELTMPAAYLLAQKAVILWC